MHFDFLNQFTKRMEHVGMHALLHKNSMARTTWKQYGLEVWHEQVNLIFMVLLYMMEQSLKDELCTMDHIGSFIDDVNMRYFKKPLSYTECKDLADFIVNTILCDEGRVMYFNGFDFDQSDYVAIHISYVANKIHYIDGEVKRTTYTLTTQGYNFLLGTLEIESHLKLTIQEMIFKMHLEKANYSQAVDDVKNIFNSLRIKLQEIQEAMRKVRQNALTYSVSDYQTLQEETLQALEETKKKYEGYKKVVKETIENLEKQHIEVKILDDKQMTNLNHLKIIETYLSRAIEEQQKILGSHFDLKSLYEKELEGISAMSLIKRFSLENELFEPMLKNSGIMARLDRFLRPLFNQDCEPQYNINKAFAPQKLVRGRQVEEEELEMLFDDGAWQEEQQRKQKEKLRKYRLALQTLLEYVNEYKTLTLKALSECVTQETICDLMPTVDIFKEIMIELIKVRKIDVEEVIEASKAYLEEESLSFHLTPMLIKLIQEEETLSEIKSIEVYRLKEDEPIVFYGVKNEQGKATQIKCSNVMLKVKR